MYTIAFVACHAIYVPPQGQVMLDLFVVPTSCLEFEKIEK